MFFHYLKYFTLSTLREKSVIFWLMLFPLILGTFFHAALIGVYDKDIKFSEIPVSVVVKRENPNFKKVMEQVSSGDDALFTTSYDDEDAAKEKLESGEVKGIIYVEPLLSLTVKSSGMDQTVIRSFVERYSTTESVIINAALNNPQKISEITESFSEELKANVAVPLTDGNMNTYMSYMYNLLAMVCVLGTTVGMNIALLSEANLSAVGIRNSLAPNSKLTKCFAGLVSGCMVQTVCSLIALIYIKYILQDDLGVSLPVAALTVMVGSWMGVAIGFFFGSVGKLSEGARQGLAIAFSMLLCFLSGLMVGDMKAICMEKIPFFNNINPAALVCDALYVVNVDGDYNRYIVKLLTMAAITLIFTILGFVATRRKRYASI
ncbi:MAG: ABC transporter permease [Ruminococcus sp.]|nr:ABC transporter permease [Ruminococcus sp.]